MKLYLIFEGEYYKLKGMVLHKSASEAIKFFSGDKTLLAQESCVKVSRTEKEPKIIFKLGQ